MYLTTSIPRVGSKRIVTNPAEGVTAGQSIAVAAVTAAATAGSNYRGGLLGALDLLQSRLDTTADKVSLLRTRTKSRLLTRYLKTRLLQHALEGLRLESATATCYSRVGVCCSRATVANVRITCRSCGHLFLREENLTPTRGVTPDPTIPTTPCRRE